MKVKGIAELQRKIRKFGDNAERQIKAVTESAGHEIATDATRNFYAYTDLAAYNDIGQSIQAVSENNGMTSTIIVQKVPMAAYIEFGTGPFVEVAEEWKGLAWQFYVNGKGWMAPRPYLYPAYTQGRRKYEADLKDMLDRLSREFNSR